MIMITFMIIFIRASYTYCNIVFKDKNLLHIIYEIYFY